MGAIAIVFMTAADARAGDTDNCLMCHRFRSLGRMDDDRRHVQNFHVDPAYYEQQLGPHSRLRCTDCHLRDEVSVVPHRPVSRVDCTSACHLAAEDRPPIEFSHQHIAQMLDTSVHSPQVLATCNDLIGRPLRKGQSTCLLCHVEPRFDRGPTPGFEDAPIQRCNVCHTEELARDTLYAFRHVHARTKPQRTHVELARGCAMCHSNDAVRRRFALPNSVASYLASFHGKAALLGSEKTAGCLDCHVQETENVHMMHAHTDPRASTYSQRLPDTCRSAACHPGAGAPVTAAAVHMEITPTRLLPATGEAPTAATKQRIKEAAGERGWRIEYFIAAMFVLLILGTFGPSAFLQVCELFQLVLGRRGKLHALRLSRAQALLADPVGRKKLVRFTVHQRVQHWVLAITFVLLVITGFPIKFADRAWAHWVINVFGGLGATRHLHRYSGLALLVGAVYHMGYVLLGLWRTSRRERIGLWQAALRLPMVVNRHDLRELIDLLRYLFFFRTSRPATGRFGLKEKFEYFGVFWGCALLGVTGVVMWANGWTSRHFTGRVLTVANLIHTMEAFLALLHVGLFHMIGVVFSPNAFPLSGAMLGGDTPINELADSHASMLEQAVATPQGEPGHA